MHTSQAGRPGWTWTNNRIKHRIYSPGRYQLRCTDPYSAVSRLTAKRHSVLLHQRYAVRIASLFKCWTLLILHPMKNKKTYTISDRIVWHPLFGVEPTPAGLEPAVLTVILRGMAPSLRADRRPPGSEPDVQTATLRGYLCRRSGIRTTAFIYIQLYHTLEQKF